MKVTYRQLALVDLTEIFLYLSKYSPNGARNVLAAINVAIKEISENPFIARPTSEADLRVKIVRRRNSRGT
jgi:plasmid stabilization system protein ParE